MKKNEINNKKLFALGILTAFSGSLCCITPLVGVLGGIGGIASTFSWLEPYRPYIIISTILILILAWYRRLKPENESKINCECNLKEELSFSQSNILLGIATLFAFTLILFPYYSFIFFPLKSNPVRITEDTENSVEIRIKIIGMTCKGCELTVNKAIKALDGVNEVDSDHNAGIVKINYNKSKISLLDFKNTIENEVGYKVSYTSIGKLNEYK